MFLHLNFSIFQFFFFLLRPSLNVSRFIYILSLYLNLHFNYKDKIQVEYLEESSHHSLISNIAFNNTRTLRS